MHVDSGGFNLCELYRFQMYWCFPILRFRHATLALALKRVFFSSSSPAMRFIPARSKVPFLLEQRRDLEEKRQAAVEEQMKHFERGMATWLAVILRPDGALLVVC